MYSVFDQFLAHSTWFTGHSLDLGRFYTALGTVVHSNQFSADTMGQYLKSKVPAVHHEYVDTLVANAWAVREYLDANP